MSGAVILAEITATPPGGGAPVTLRFADRSIRPFPPGDADRPNAIFDPRMVTAPALRRELWTDMASLSPGSGAGAMELANADRALDAWQGHSWGDIRVWRWQEGTGFADGQLLLSGSCAPPGYGYSSSEPGRVKVYLADAWQELRKPLQGALYSGGNDGSTVLYEGTPAGLAGSPKPLAYGSLTAAHLPAPQVNTALQAYQVHQGEASASWPAGALDLYDRGAPAGYTYEGDFSGAAFDTRALDPSGYCTDRARGLVRIEGQPVGALTFGVSAPLHDTPGLVLAALMEKAGIAPERIDASVTPASAPDIGVWYGESVAAGDAVNFAARSLGHILSPGRDGIWRGRELGPPSDPADYFIMPSEIVSLTSDERAPDPAGEIRVGYDRVWRRFTETEIAPALRGDPQEERLAAEYRWASVVDADAKAAYPNSWRRMDIPTALRNPSDAADLASTLAALFGLRSDGRRRRAWRIVLEVTQARLAISQQLGGTIGLYWPQAGVEGNFLLIGEELMRPSRDLMIWTLWG